jgi:hypothetical protein
MAIVLFQIVNNLTYPLSFVNLAAPGDSVTPINPGITVTPGSNGNGCNVANCTGQQYWRNHVMIISGGQLYLNLWTDGTNVYCWVGNSTTYPPQSAWITLATPGSNPQQLTISPGSTSGTFTFAMSDLPA